MRKLTALLEAMATGVHKGALIHEKSGTAHAVEVLAVEDNRLMGVAYLKEGEMEMYRPQTRVRIELPQDASVVYVPGTLVELRRVNGVSEVEILCPEGAEHRQRRMDVRVCAECRIRVASGDEWVDTRTVNLSSGGALVANGTAAAAGDTVDVELDLGGEPIRCRAEVVRRGVKVHGISSRTNAALRFVGLPEPVRDRIALYVLSQHAADKAGRPAKRSSKPSRRQEAEDG